ncbi:MAG: hypothetical protein ACTSW1_13345 [Candidatus Hodarchaeales archaeon]
MVRIYLDLETYRPDENGAFIDEKIITAGLLVDKTSYNKNSLRTIIPPIIFSEWNGYNEQKIISLVEKQIKKALKSYRFTVVCGYNILRYDIPLLICKSMKYTNNDPSIQGRLWWDPLSIDLQQQVLVLNNNMFKGTTLGNVVQKAKQLKLNPPEYHEPGYAMRELYPSKQYKEIEKHLIQDLRIVRWLDLFGLKRLNEESVRIQKPLFRDL